MKAVAGILVVSGMASLPTAGAVYPAQSIRFACVELARDGQGTNAVVYLQRTPR
jgi:hypothetical protein